MDCPLMLKEDTACVSASLLMYLWRGLHKYQGLDKYRLIQSGVKSAGFQGTLHNYLQNKLAAYCLDFFRAIWICLLIHLGGWVTNHPRQK